MMKSYPARFLRTKLKKMVLLLMMIAMVVTSVQIFAAPPTAQAAEIDRIVARINNEIVTLHEVRQAATPFLLQQGVNPEVLKQPQQREEIYKETLNDLIDRKLLVQEALKLELSVSDEEVDQWLAFTRQQQNMTDEDFRAMIRQYGLEYDGYREMIRENLLRMRLVNVRIGSQVSIAQSDVDAEYRKRFGAGSPTQTAITVSHILVQPASESADDRAEAKARAEALLVRLKNGEDFVTLARAESDGPGARMGGEIGTFIRGELDPEFEAQAFKVKTGDYSPVVQTRFGYHIITVTNREQRAVEAGSEDERKAQIRGELQQRAVERQLEVYIQTLRNRSFVEVRF